MKNLVSTFMSRVEVFRKMRVLKHFTKFTGNQLCRSLNSNNVAGLS